MDNKTPLAQRVHIGFFGIRNAGKSSLANAFTNQPMSVVSEVLGTTTDPVRKTMELLPLGPVVIIDTAGIDDEGEIGSMRVKATEKILRKCHIAVLVTEAGRELNADENRLVKCFKERNLPFIIAKNKADLVENTDENSENTVCVSAKNGKGIDDLKNAVANIKLPENKNCYLSDLVGRGDFVLLVMPIDGSAPKGRIIMPQQMAVREILDAGAVSVAVQPDEIENALAGLSKKPSLAVTDSQVFSQVNKALSGDIPLTSFSILMARYKGFLKTAVQGAKTIDNLKNGAKILISEGCTHHRQCGDIGRDKLPVWLENYTKKKLDFQWTSGADFPENLSDFDLIVHCGGCMLDDKEMQFRRNEAENQGVPFTNYGTAIAHMNGILERSIEMIPEL